MTTNMYVTQVLSAYLCGQKEYCICVVEFDVDKAVGSLHYDKDIVVSSCTN